MWLSGTYTNFTLYLEIVNFIAFPVSIPTDSIRHSPLWMWWH